MTVRSAPLQSRQSDGIHSDQKESKRAPPPRRTQRIAALDASQQLKIVGVLVIGLSGLVLFFAAVGLEVDPKKIPDALLACLALWGLATGIGLLLLRPWARLSSLVFYGLLCISGALSVALIVVHIFANVVDVLDTLFTAPFALISVTMGVQGLRFFKRNDIRRHFGGT